MTESKLINSLDDLRHEKAIELANTYQLEISEVFELFNKFYTQLKRGFQMPNDKTDTLGAIQMINEWEQMVAAQAIIWYELSLRDTIYFKKDSNAFAVVDYDTIHYVEHPDYHKISRTIEPEELINKAQGFLETIGPLQRDRQLYIDKLALE